MGKPRSKKEQEERPVKRSRSQADLEEDGDASASRMLAKNKFASLAVKEVEKKEKIPPFFVKGFPDNLRADFNMYIQKGLQATIRLSADGYKIVVPSMPHYKAVEEYLKRKGAEYYTHDFAANKPFKVLLRGLPDMELEELKTGLTDAKLKVEAVFKINRHDKTIRYRDQPYLVHLSKGSANLTELRNIGAMFNIIIEWEKYRPKHRDVTQCTNCLNFGHGTKNCHIKSRCNKCTGEHKTSECMAEESASKCANCGQDHATTNRNCPKRAEFIKIRNAATTRHQPKRKKEIVLDPSGFPALPSRNIRPIPVLAPLPLPSPRARVMQSEYKPQTSSAAHSSSPPPGFITYAQATSLPPKEGLYTMEEMSTLLFELDSRISACSTKDEQVRTMMSFYFHHSQILTQSA